MHLPRGNFISLKKGIVLSSFLMQSRQDHYTGLVIISSDKVSGSLLFQRGSCILADLPPHSGREAIDEIAAQAEDVVDIELYALSDSQMQLALEFNPSYRTGETGGETTGSVEQAPNTGQRERGRTSGYAPFPGSSGATIMLPRGKFFSKIEEVPLSAILEDLKTAQFSGYGLIKLGAGEITVVTDGGAILLAHFPPQQGSGALQLMQQFTGELVNADLYSLSPAQMKLALEFNHDYRITTSAKKSVLRIKPQRIGEKPPKRERVAAAPLQAVSDIDSQLRVLDTLNVDVMTAQIREDFRGVVEDLDLGHLLDEDESGREEDQKGAKKEPGREDHGF
jgi:hypothetical protein